MTNKILFVAVILVTTFSSCLKKNSYYEDFSSTQPIADIPKAAANAVKAAAPTNSWFILDSAAGPVDYLTAVHLSATNHVGDATIKMKIDLDAANTWISTHPTAGYEVLPADLYTAGNLSVVIPNAGVYSTGDFSVNIKANADNGSGVSRFKGKKYILPISIDDASPYGVSTNYKTILWNVRVKLK